MSAIFTLILKLPALAWLAVSGLSVALGDYFSKSWANQPSYKYAICTIFMYCMSGLAWLPVIYKKNQLAVMGAAWSVIATLFTIIIGVFIFDEALSTFHWLGLGLAMLALGLLSLG